MTRHSPLLTPLHTEITDCPIVYLPRLPRGHEGVMCRRMFRPGASSMGLNNGTRIRVNFRAAPIEWLTPQREGEVLRDKSHKSGLYRHIKATSYPNPPQLHVGP